MATEFTLFPTLITELQLEIWRLALLDIPRRPLFLYKNNGWIVEELGRDGPDPNGENLQVRFDDFQFSPFRIPLPLYSVNRESHDVAVKYLQEHKLLAFRRTTGPEWVFLRYFNP